ncbi:Ldh family oxidoreductase [Mycobacterium sp.]|jgi:hypothetical protein|uniref:Ldh family oxidoreductase n=1 Tax=Mycobacterium sp. TaxID=1785 RepID=UPI002D2883B1|nr:Ldh family oxidoreductase [Mycobacterium sp.]HZA08923.1 Ldh family oxidoreductase [Mycobacterium sp.]
MRSGTPVAGLLIDADRAIGVLAGVGRPDRGIAITSAASRIAPHGGVEPLFGTNPMSVAAGGEGEEFALDMATGQVCFGEIKHRRAGTGTKARD